MHCWAFQASGLLKTADSGWRKVFASVSGVSDYAKFVRALPGWSQKNSVTVFFKSKLNQIVRAHNFGTSR